MKHNKMMKHILPVLLAAMVAFSSLGLGSLASPVQAEETSVTIMPRNQETDTRVHITEGENWYPKITFDFLQSDSITATAGNWSDNTDTSWYDSDTDASNYTLYTAKQLAGLAKLVNAGTTFQGKTIALGQSVDISEHFWDAAIGSTTFEDGANDKLKGTFDGHGYSVIGLRIKTDDSSKRLSNGFFGTIPSSATIQNLTLDDPFISVDINNDTTGEYALSPLTCLNLGTINNCVVNGGRIYGNAQYIRMAGIASSNNTHAVITECTISDQTRFYGIANAKSAAGDKPVSVTTGGIVGDNGSDKAIRNCVNGGSIAAWTGGNVPSNAKILVRHFIGGCVGNNTGNGSQGQVLNSVNHGKIEVHADGKDCGYGLGRGFYIGGVLAVTATTTNGCANTGDIYVDGAQNVSSGYGAVGGLCGVETGGSVKYSYNTGKITTNHSSVGGITGYLQKGNIEFVYNTAEVDAITIGPKPATSYVGGLAGYVADGNVNSSYSLGTITNENPASNDGKGGLTGKSGGTFKNCFYLGAGKASGDGNNSGTAINLAAIKKPGSNIAIDQIKQGDDTAQVVLADASQLDSLKGTQALGANFGVQLPAASAFVSDTPSAVQAITGADNTVGLKTSGGTGGHATFTAKMYLTQNELVNGAYTGPVKSVEAPITLNLNVVYVGLNNKSPTSAIEDTTDFGLRAGVTFGGTGVDKDSYTLKWFKSSNKQSSPPDSSAAGAEVAGLTETWDDVTAGEVTWKKTADTKAQFTADDAGWYKLRATPSNSAGAFKDYTFETAWQYLSVDNLMVFDDSSTMPDKIELSRQDTDIENKTRLAVKIEIADGFTGSIKYGWYKVDETTTPIAGTEKTAAITTDAAAHTITDTLTVGNAYSDALKGTYQLIVTSVTPDGQTAQTKDIRGPASEIRCYNAEIKDDYVQAGPGYEGTPGNTMTQSIITLSEDFAASMYDAYWIKGGVLDNSTNLSDYTQVRHATLTAQGDGTYKAIAAFNMEKGCEGDNYQLVIYPTNTTRPYRTDTAMQFKGAANCVLTLYSIDTVTYDLADRYSTTEMTAEGVLIPSPGVDTNNPEGSLTYTKVSGPETFTIDSAGRIICPTDLSAISNGLYTYTIKVTEEGFKNDAGAVLSGPGMSKNVTISFQVTGSSDFPLTDKNLYIYDTGYILADSEPDQATAQIIPYQGIYNIPAGTGESNVWQHTITVVSGEHTGSGRIILGGSFSTTGAPITVKTGATAQVSIADGTGITLTNTSSGGPSLKSDGSLILAGGAGTSTLNAPGGIAGNGSLTIGTAEYKGMTVDTSAITTQSTTIESGHVKVTGNIAGSVAIKGGNVKAATIGESGATTIDGGTIIGAVADGAKNSEGEPVYPVTLKVSDNPESYKDQALTVLQSKKTSKTSTATRQWEATASGDSFSKDSGSGDGELYVYLPHYPAADTEGYTTKTAMIGTGNFTRNIRANKDSSLTTSLLSDSYQLRLPTTPIAATAKVGHGVTADIKISIDPADGWLYEGRSIDLEISPGDSYRDIWGKYLLKKEGANADAYKPEFWIQTPSGSALSKAGYFGTLTEQSRTSGQTGQLIVPADSRITEGTYKSQLNWKIIPNDPVVGGEK